MLDQSRLKEILHYDPETGVFTWLKPTSNRVRVGAVCDTVGPIGYVVIGLLGKRQYAHRLAWLYMTGEWPSDQVDHVNCIKLDNRWSNLRVAGKSKNMQNIGLRSNNSSGFTGVGFHAQTGRWRAFIVVAGKMVHVGLFDTIEQASRARENAAIKQYGEFYHAG
jgi:hypothetical protein